jgi:hypothetical protein
MAVDVAGDRDRRVPEHIRDRFDVHPDLLHACLARGGLDGPHLVAGLRSETANVVAPLASQSATVRVASLTGAPASSRSRGPAELVADVLAGAAVDGVPLSLTVVAGVGDRTLVANDLAVLHPLVDAAFTVRVLAPIHFFPLASTWGSRPTSLHLAAQRLVTFPWPA